MRKKDDQKRISIKNAVVQIILEQGMHGASISKIAKYAGVSPATVYIYYENKDEMIRSIYQEYAEDIFGHLLGHITQEMSGEEFIDSLVREYYNYITNYNEIFHFIEQFDSCPSLKQTCICNNGPNRLNDMLIQYKASGIIKDYDNSNIVGMLLYPVKSIASKSVCYSKSPDEQLDEMIKIIQDALLF